MKTKKAALYIRVSTHHQIDKDSLPLQRQDLINYAKYILKIEDYVIFEDAGYSGKNTERPEYQQMMNRIRNNEFTHLLVWKIDRISRNLRDFTEMYDELKKYNIIFISKNEQFDTSTAMGEAMLKIILVFAELERKLASERVTAIMLSRAEKGLWNGATVPLGYMWCDQERFPVKDSEEAETVEYIYELYENLKSTNEVAYTLNEENKKTKRGGKWTAKTVRDILRNSFYIGTYTYNKRESGRSRRLKDESEWIVVEDNHEGIVSKEKFETVNKILTDNYNYKNPRQRKDFHTHIFAKRLYCDVCGQLLTAGHDRERKDGYRPSRYTCSTNRTTRNIYSCNTFISDIIIAPFIFNFVANLLRLQESPNIETTKNRSLIDIKRMLLRGNPFVDVDDINKEALEKTYLMTVHNIEKDLFLLSKEETIDNDNFALSRLKRERERHLKALERLEDLYLYDDIQGVNKKGYVKRRTKITYEIKNIEKRISNLLSNSKDLIDYTFINNARHFLFTHTLLNKRNIDFRELIDVVGIDVLADFIDSIIEKIVIKEKLVQSIIFKNGLTYYFKYKPPRKRKRQIQQLGRYKDYINDVLIYIKEEGSASRRDIEKHFNLNRNSAYNIISELMATNLVIRKGNSVAIRYFYNDKLK